MHGTFERPRETRDRSIRRNWGDFRFLAIPTLIAVALVALMITQPDASKWISEATQVEAGIVMPDDAPTQLARPAGEVRTVRTN